MGSKRPASYTLLQQSLQQLSKVAQYSYSHIADGRQAKGSGFPKAAQVSERQMWE